MTTALLAPAGLTAERVSHRERTPVAGHVDYSDVRARKATNSVLLQQGKCSNVTGGAVRGPPREYAHAVGWSSLRIMSSPGCVASCHVEGADVLRAVIPCPAW